MILVTTGTFNGFRTMIENMDRLAAAELADFEIIAQIGNCQYEPQHMTWFRFKEQIPELFAAAELIVGHGGTGTTIESLKLGKRFVGVSNPLMADNHQHEFLEELAGKGLLVHCSDPAHLGESIEQAWQLDPPTVDTCAYGRSLAVAIEGDLRLRADRVRNTFWRRLNPLRRTSRGLEADVATDGLRVHSISGGTGK